MIVKHEKIDFGTRPLIEKVTIKPPFRLSLNFPNDACFIFFNSGSTIINAPYEQKTVEDKEAVLLRCGTYFTDLLPRLEQQVYEILVFHLPKEIIRQIYRDQFPASLISAQKTFIHKVRSTQILAEFIKGLQFYFNEPAVVTHELLKLKIQELILLLLQTGNVDTLKQLLTDTFSPIQVSIKEVVYRHIFTDCNINDLAVLCNMSLSSFKRHFRKIFNDTPSNFFKMKRLEKARDLIQHSTLSIAEIAFETCFYDAAHFSKAFKAKYGHTAGQYRKTV